MPSLQSQCLLYAAAGLAGLTFAGHTKMGFDVIIPSLKKLHPKDEGAKAAKIGWFEVNEVFLFISIFCVKWARLGMTDVYDKTLFGVYAASQAYASYAYFKSGMSGPLLPLLGVPSLIGLSQLV